MNDHSTPMRVRCCPNCGLYTADLLRCSSCNTLCCGHCFEIDFAGCGSTGICPACRQKFILSEGQVCANCLRQKYAKSSCPHCHGPLCHHCFIPIIDSDGSSLECPHCHKASPIPGEWYTDRGAC